MIDESKLNFHEASVIEFTKHNNNVKLVVENVFYGKELKNVILTLNKVTKIETDAKNLNDNDNFMSAEDGEIIFLDLSKNMVKFVVEWNNYMRNLHFKTGYKIDFENYNIILS